MAKSSTGLEENIAGLLCYLGGLITGVIFCLIEKESQFVKFHGMQSIIIFGACGILSFVPFVNLIVWIVAVVLWIILMTKAYQKQKFKLPGIGNLAEKWASR